jgi:fructose-1,6-bisphosphatase I
VAVLSFVTGRTHAFSAPRLPTVSVRTALFSTTESKNPIMHAVPHKIPVFDEVCETTGVTLTRFMNEVAILNPEIQELTTLFGAINTACKAMSNLVKRSQLPSSETLGFQGKVNVQGEDQKVSEISYHCK